VTNQPRLEAAVPFLLAAGTKGPQGYEPRRCEHA
jgi:hypothetical protein